MNRTKVKRCVSLRAFEFLLLQPCLKFLLKVLAALEFCSGFLPLSPRRCVLAAELLFFNLEGGLMTLLEICESALSCNSRVPLKSVLLLKFTC